MVTADIAFTVRVAVGLVFTVGAIAKFSAPSRFEGTLRDYRMLPGRAVGLAARLLPPVEAALALTLPLGVLRPWADAAAACLLVLFGVAMAVNLLRGRTIECGCTFGGGGSHRLRWRYVSRNVGLAGLLLACARGGVPTAPQTVTGVLGGIALFLVLEAANTLWALPAPRAVSPA